MRRKRLLASLAVVAGLGIGGVAGVILAVPGISAAQTTTDPPATTVPPTTVPPAEDPTAPGPADRDRAKGDGSGCPDKDGEADGSGSSAGTSDEDAFYNPWSRDRGGEVRSL